MKYYIIAGEASGDLHASNLMEALKKTDTQAEFRFFGGDLMKAQGGTLVQHYKEMAFMGFVAVLANIRKVLSNIALCKKDIATHLPDSLILVDYPSFNLKMAEYVKKNFPDIPVYYYISPKIWAWKEYRIREIKKFVDHIFSILPFEVEYYKKHDYTITYVGNPSVDAIEKRKCRNETYTEFISSNKLPDKPIVAVLAGSRKQEIKHCLPVMLKTAESFPDYQFVVAGAPGITPEFYKNIVGDNSNFAVLFGKTYNILQQSEAALINSGTASLEAALLNTPQVVGYYVFGGRLARLIFQKIIKVKWASLVNLIAGRLVVKELLADHLTVDNMIKELQLLLTDEEYRRDMQNAYAEVRKKLGPPGASDKAAHEIYRILKTHRSEK